MGAVFRHDLNKASDTLRFNAVMNDVVRGAAAIIREMQSHPSDARASQLLSETVRLAENAHREVNYAVNPFQTFASREPAASQNTYDAKANLQTQFPQSTFSLFQASSFSDSLRHPSSENRSVYSNSPFSSFSGGGFSAQGNFFDAAPGGRSREDGLTAEGAKMLDSLRGNHTTMSLFAGRGISESLSFAGFAGILMSTGLTDSYNDKHGAGGKMEGLGRDYNGPGGIENEVGILTDWLDSPEEADATSYTICYPNGVPGEEDMPFSEAELKQLWREISYGVFTADAYPYFSLQFSARGDGHQYSLIHPVYENTLVGERIASTDHLMKCFLNGGFYDDAFLQKWARELNTAPAYLKANLIDFKQYCDEQGVDYHSLRELMADIGLNTTRSGYHGLPFMTAFRIINFQERVESSDGVSIMRPGFRIEGECRLNPDYEAYVDNYKKEHGCLPDDFQKTLLANEMAKELIKKVMPKLPICKAKFKQLGVINHMCYVANTLKQQGKIPVLSQHKPERNYQAPASYPPIPVRYYKTVPLKVTLKDVFEIMKTQDEAAQVKLNTVLEGIVFNGSDEALNETLKNKIKAAVKTCLQQKTAAAGIQASELTLKEIEKLTGKVFIKFRQFVMHVYGEFNQQCNSINRTLERSALNRNKVTTAQTELRTRYDRLITSMDAPGTDLNKFKKDIRKYLPKPEATLLLVILSRAPADFPFNQLKPNIVRIAGERCAELTQGASKIMEMMSPQQRFLEIELVSDYQYSALGLTGMNLSQETGDRLDIVGGCDMRLDKAEVVPIPNAETFVAAAKAASPREAETLGRMQMDGQEYLVWHTDIQSRPERLDEEMHMLSSALGDENSLKFWQKTVLLERLMAFALNQPKAKEKMGEGLFLQDRYKRWNRDGSTLPHYAAALLAGSQFKELFGDDPSLFTITDLKEFQPIHVAAGFGNVSLLAELATNPAVREAKTRMGYTPLILAVLHNQFEAVNQLARLGADPTVLLPNGLFVLYIALQNRNSQMALLLLEKFPSIRVSEKLDNYMTPLHLAIDLGFTDVAMRLIERGATFDVRRKADEYTALHCAVAEGNIPLIEAMRLKGANLHCTLSSGENLLHLAAKRGKDEVVAHLLAKGVSPNVENRYKETPLMLAIKAHQEKTAHLLARQTAVNHVNDHDQTASLMAAQLGLYSVSDILIDRGEDVNRCDKQGLNTVYYFVQNIETARVQALMNARKINTAQLYDGMSLSALAIQRSPLLYQMFAAANVDYQYPNHVPLTHWFIVHDDVYQLRQHKKAFNSHETALKAACLAAEHRSPTCLAWLLSETVLKNDVSLNPEIFLAIVKGGSVELLKAHEEKLCSMDLVLDEANNTALHIAAHLGFIDCVEYLLSRGAQASIRNRFGKTAFHLAWHQADEVMFKLLLKQVPKEQWPQDLLQNTAATPAMMKLLAENHYPIANVARGLSLPERSRIQLEEKRRAAIARLTDVDQLSKELAFAIQVDNFDAAIEWLEQNPALIDGFHLGEGLSLFTYIMHNATPAIESAVDEADETEEDEAELDVAETSSAKKRTLEDLLQFLQAKGYDPSLHLGDDNPLRALLNVNEELAIFRWELLEKFFPGSLSILLADPLRGKATFQKILVTNKKTKLFGHISQKEQQIEDPTVKRVYPLHEAVTENHYSLCSDLLKVHDVNAYDHKGRTALMLAAGAGNLRLMQLLIQHGANVEMTDIDGDNALHYALQSASLEAALFLLPLLKEKNRPNRKKITPLVLACRVKSRSGDLAPVARILLADSDCRAVVDMDGLTALHHAAAAGVESMISLLVEAGLDVNAELNPTDEDKQKKSERLTPLHMAASHGNIGAVKKLLELGADPLKSSKKGYSFFEYAILSNNFTMLQFAFSLPAFDACAHHASLLNAIASANNSDALETLLCHPRHADINSQNENSFTPLHYAAAYGATRVIQLLLSHGALFYLKDMLGNTALHNAAFYGKVSACEALLRHAPETINEVNHKNKTPLILVCEKGAAGALALLLKYNPDLDAKDSSGLTAIQQALLNGHVSLVNRLLKAGDTNLQREKIETLNRKEREKLTQLIEKHFSHLLTQKKPSSSMRTSRQVGASSSGSALFGMAKTAEQLHQEEIISKLFEACARGDCDTVNQILEMQPKFIYANLRKDDITLLQMSVLCGQKEVLQLLEEKLKTKYNRYGYSLKDKYLENFLEINSRKLFENNPLDTHSFSQLKEIVKLRQALFTACEQGDITTVREIVALPNLKLSLNIPSETSFTALELALLGGHANIVSLLIGKETPGYRYQVPYRSDIARKYLVAAKTAFEQGTLVETRSQLKRAIESQRELNNLCCIDTNRQSERKLIALLKEGLIDLTLRGVNNLYPAQLALIQGNFGVLDILLANGDTSLWASNLLPSDPMEKALLAQLYAHYSQGTVLYSPRQSNKIYYMMQFYKNYWGAKKLEDYSSIGEILFVEGPNKLFPLQDALMRGDFAIVTQVLNPKQKINNAEETPAFINALHAQLSDTGIAQAPQEFQDSLRLKLREYRQQQGSIALLSANSTLFGVNRLQNLASPTPWKLASVSVRA